MEARYSDIVKRQKPMAETGEEIAARVINAITGGGRT